MGLRDPIWQRADATTGDRSSEGSEQLGEGTSEGRLPINSTHSSRLAQSVVDL